MILRPYQILAREKLYEWMTKNEGNPCVVLPTGAGKSVCIADVCKDIISNYTETKILILTHVRELIFQNYEKFLTLYPEADAGIYSAGIGRKELDKRIIFASIQSIHRKSGFYDLVIIDECHLINHNETGIYRKFINQLKIINPCLRVVGYTGTPYRFGHGLITDKPALFDALIEPATILELITAGYLSKLKSKATPTKLLVDDVKKRGGEYVKSELQKAVNKTDYNKSIVAEVIARSEGRKAWLFFCTGVEHAYAIRDELKAQGINAETITGETPKAERERIIEDYKSGKITALTNANVLTTGFDYPDIDLIALCRPTMSAGLYCQMAGRGLRIKSHIDNCLVLDFAGCVAQHGAIIDVKPPDKKKKGEGIAPSKECPECFEIIAAQCRTCPECGYEFPKKEKEYFLRDDDIMGSEKLKKFIVKGWNAHKYLSKAGKNVLKIEYFGEHDSAVEYLCIWHNGTAGNIARSIYHNIFNLSQKMINPPEEITYMIDGKFKKIIKRDWKKVDKVTSSCHTDI